MRTAFVLLQHCTFLLTALSPSLLVNFLLSCPYCHVAPYSHSWLRAFAELVFNLYPSPRDILSVFLESKEPQTFDVSLVNINGMYEILTEYEWVQNIRTVLPGVRTSTTLVFHLLHTSPHLSSAEQAIHCMCTEIWTALLGRSFVRS